MATQNHHPAADAHRTNFSAAITIPATLDLHPEHRRGERPRHILAAIATVKVSDASDTGLVRFTRRRERAGVSRVLEIDQSPQLLHPNSRRIPAHADRPTGSTVVHSRPLSDRSLCDCPERTSSARARFANRVRRDFDGHRLEDRQRRERRLRGTSTSSRARSSRRGYSHRPILSTLTTIYVRPFDGESPRHREDQP